LRTTELWVSAKPTPLPHHFTLFGLFALTGPNLHIIHFPHAAYRVQNLTSRRVVVAYISTSTANMARFQIILAVLASFIWCSSAQFGFFDQMFGGGGGQQHQEPQNVRSDSSWYQAQYEGGMSICSFFTHHIFIISPQPGSHYFYRTCSTVTSNGETPKFTANVPSQHNALTTSAPALFLASTSRTTALALGKMWKTKSNSATASRSVAAREDGPTANLQRRSSWPGKACYKG